MYTRARPGPAAGKPALRGAAEVIQTALNERGFEPYWRDEEFSPAGERRV